jgi:hypothetical protein
MEAKLSPSGDRLALIVTARDRKDALVVVDLLNGRQLTQAASFKDADVVDVHWINEERLVFGVANAAHEKPSERKFRGLYAVDADGSELVQLVLRNKYVPANEIEVSKAIRNPVVAGNIQLLSVPTAEPGSVDEDVLLADVDHLGHLRPFWLNTRTRLRFRADFGLPNPPIRLFTNSRGFAVLALTPESNSFVLSRRLVGTQEWIPIAKYESQELPFRFVGSDDHGTLFLSRPMTADGHEALLQLDVGRGMTKSKPLVDLPGFDFEGQVLTDTGSGMLEGIRVMHSRELTIWTTPAMQSFQQQIDALMPGHVNRVDCRKCGQADMVALITSYSDQNPGQLMVYRAGAAEPWTRLGPLRPEAPTDQGASVQFKRIRARDGLDLPVWITRPAGASGPLPTVMLVHGGPWLRGWRWEWNPMAQFLASRGYLVIAPEIRGSTGYGRAHYVAGFKQFGQAMQDDVADALRWAQAEGLASDRACIAGASYGGYSTLMGLIKDADLYRCGVASLAPADLNLYLEPESVTSIDAGRYWMARA